MQIQAIENWEYIFLDTSVIFDYLKNPNNKTDDEKSRIEKTKKLFDEALLSSNKVKSIYVSAITLAEFTKSKVPKNVQREIIEIFFSYQITFIDFTAVIARDLQKNLATYLPEGQFHQLNAQLKELKKDEGIMSVRQWLADDLKILASAKSRKKLDVILTSDLRTFLPYAKRMELPCLPIQNIELDLFKNIVTDKKFEIK